MHGSQPGKGFRNAQKLSCVTMCINNHNARQKVVNKWQSRGKKQRGRQKRYTELRGGGHAKNQEYLGQPESQLSRGGMPQAAQHSRQCRGDSALSAVVIKAMMAMIYSLFS